MLGGGVKVYERVDGGRSLKEIARHRGAYQLSSLHVVVTSQVSAFTPYSQQQLWKAIVEIGDHNPENANAQPVRHRHTCINHGVACHVFWHDDIGIHLIREAQAS